MQNKLKELEKENHNLREQLENFIPRRRVRRIYKMLGDILDENTDTIFYVTILKDFINKITKIIIQASVYSFNNNEITNAAINT